MIDNYIHTYIELILSKSKNHIPYVCTYIHTYIQHIHTYILTWKMGAVDKYIVKPFNLKKEEQK
jgi:hypothetical protein